jgi:RNA polymerase sigma factor (sigma-70 family)
METFATTHWTVVLAAGRSGQPQGEAALADLCRIYWYPLYAYVRRGGYAPTDAEDLTQGFFLHLIQGNAVARADRNKGRFRSFLLGALNHYLADAQARAQTQKRGGGWLAISIDGAEAEERYRLEPVDAWSPDRLFERQWALALLDQVFQRLEKAESEAGRGAVFERLRQFVAFAGGAQPYAEVAQALGMTEEAVKKAVQRLRHRYQQLFRQEICQTVENPTEVDAEIHYLCETMAR